MLIVNHLLNLSIWKLGVHYKVVLNSWTLNRLPVLILTNHDLVYSSLWIRRHLSIASMHNDTTWSQLPVLCQWFLHTIRQIQGLQLIKLQFLIAMSTLEETLSTKVFFWTKCTLFYYFLILAHSVPILEIWFD